MFILVACGDDGAVRAGSSAVAGDSPTEGASSSTGVVHRGDFLIALDEALFSVASTGEQSQLLDWPTAVAVGDGAGGVVLQTLPGWEGADGDRVIWRLARGASEPVPLVRVGPDERLTLHDTATIDGEVTVFYVRHRGGIGPHDTTDTLHRIEIASGADVEIGEVGGWEARSDPISVGGGVLARYWTAEARSGFAFETLEGTMIDMPGDPYRSPDWPDGYCPDDIRCPRAVAISGDGSRFGYAEGVVTADGLLHHYRLVVVATATGERITAIDLPMNGQESGTPSSIELTEGIAVVNRQTWTGNGVPINLHSLVIDLHRAEVTELPLRGVARLP